MRLATVIVEQVEHLVLCEKSGFFRIADFNRKFQQNWPETMEALIKTERLTELSAWFRQQGRPALDRITPLTSKSTPVRYAPLYRHPPKIWGIGLNYSAHARDLSEKVPTLAPASFMKPDTAIIGSGDTIRIPRLSEKTTAEAELGIVIGRRCKDVPPEKWLEKRASKPWRK